MLTAHLLTKNNAETIRKTLESLVVANPKIVIGDYGSTDDTLKICREFGADVTSVSGMKRNEARNYLMRKSSDSLNIWIEPWEAIVQNHSILFNFKENAGHVRVIQSGTASWEIRLWRGDVKFINPVFERLDINDAKQTGLVLFSKGSIDPETTLTAISQWKNDSPLMNQPHYYHACVLLSQGKYEDFLRTAEHYLYLDKSNSMPAIMTRYYYAMIQMTVKRLVKPTLQNMNLCLCVKPLMAEFWCLTGDVYYHLLNKFEMAKEFYENAIVMGSKRLVTDLWPMDIAKYGKYPKIMIESCDSILSTRNNFIKTTNIPQQKQAH